MDRTLTPKQAQELVEQRIQDFGLNSLPRVEVAFTESGDWLITWEEHRRVEPPMTDPQWRQWLERHVGTPRPGTARNARGLKRLIDGQLLVFARARAGLRVLVGGAHELDEQRVRRVRPALELGVELAADEVRVLGQLDHLDEPLVGRRAARARGPRFSSCSRYSLLTS